MRRAAATYCLYGLDIASDFILAEAQVSDVASPDVRIIRAKIDMPEVVKDGFRDFQITNDGDLFVFTGVGRFLVRSFAEILVDLDAGFDERLVGLPLLGPVIAVLLHRRRQFVLHGSCVIIDGQAEIFLGDKGAGKSTTAATLVAQGFAMIADDVVGLTEHAGQPVLTFAGHQGMKLDEPMLERFGANAGQIIEPQDGAYTAGKIRFRLNRSNVKGGVIVRRIHVLARGQEHALTLLNETQALQALIRFSYFPRLGPETLSKAETANMFKQAATLAGRISAYRLTVKNDVNAIGDLPDFLRKEAGHGFRAVG